jgi:hypothetical protein
LKRKGQRDEEEACASDAKGTSGDAEGEKQALVIRKEQVSVMQKE